MKPRTPGHAVEQLLGALSDKRWEDVIPLVRAEALHRIVDSEKDSVRYRLGPAYADRPEEQAELRALWRVNDENELEELSPREFFYRFLDAKSGAVESAFAPSHWRVLGAVKQNSYAFQVVYESRDFGGDWAWPRSCPMATYVVRVLRVRGEWRVDVDSEFFEIFEGRLRYFRSRGDPIGMAMTYVIAEVWSKVGAAHPEPLHESRAFALQFHRLRIAALDVEHEVGRVFVDPEAAKVEISTRLEEDEAIWLLLEDPGAFSPVYRYASGESLVAAIFAYVARVAAFHLLGLPVPRSEGTPQLADALGRCVSQVIEKFATTNVLGPPGLARLERALLEVVGAFPEERAALGMLVPEIYQLVLKVRERE